MGCFSFMCKKCGESIKSNSFRGQKAKLFLLKEGKVIQEMEGEYDSYGRVFIDGTQYEGVERDLMKSIEWYVPDEGIEEWDDACNLMFDPNTANGIAAIHSQCFTGEIPAKRSAGDPDQGWGDDWEYFGDTSPDKEIE